MEHANGSAHFRSFWMGGFECSTHINGDNVRLDMIASTRHDAMADRDYALLASLGMFTARDGLRWHLIDQRGAFSFDSWLPQLRAALNQGVQVIWDLCHYGFPDGLDLFSAEFVNRFERFARAAARVFADHTDEVPYWTPVNEISFFTWGAVRPLIYPFAAGRDAELKAQLVRAALSAARAVREVDPRARLVYPEPILNAIAPPGQPDLAILAERENEAQWESWDMIAGLRDPHLGGAPEYLDIVGANFYYRNQWEQREDERVYFPWQPEIGDSRWIPLSELLSRTYARYGRPLFVAETGHFGKGRAPWLAEIARQVQRCCERGVPIGGVCLYPIIDRHDWNDAQHWHNAGMWDLRGPNMTRVLDDEYAEELDRNRDLLNIGPFQFVSGASNLVP